MSKEDILNHKIDVSGLRKKILPINIFTDETLSIPINLKGAYSIIAQLIGLKFKKDNIFIDKDNRCYYWDRYGFHPVNVYKTIKIKEIEVRIAELNSKEQKFKEANSKLKQRESDLNDEIQSLVGKKRKKVINIILNSTCLSDSEKLNNIKDYVNSSGNEVLNFEHLLYERLYKK